MIELLVAVCLIDDPSRCKDVNLTYAESLTPMQCLVQAPPQLARWSREHPGWRIRRWACRAAGVLART